MSTGPFLDAFYESDTAEIHRIRIQPETASLAQGGTTNTIPAGPATNQQQVRVSASRNSFGIKARKVRIRLTSPTTVGGIIAAGSVLEFPWLQRETFLQVTRPGGQVVTYQGGSGIVIGGTPETFTG